MRLVSIYYKDYFPFDLLPFVNETFFTGDPDDLKEGDIIVVWGGADISPSLYNKRVSKYCHADAEPSIRDQVEWACMKRAVELKIPIIGVCRGAQMLCALAGGYLIQHVGAHGGHHAVQTPDGEFIKANSIHHQMMAPWGVKHEMLGVIPTPLSPFYWDEDNMVNVPNEPEYVYFPEVLGFAIQWHPEMMMSSCEATQYIFKTMQERLNA